MSAVGKIYKREVNGELRDVEAVTAYMGIYKNPINGFWYAIDWNHKHRAAFVKIETARNWIRTAAKAFQGLPSTNSELIKFNDAMKLRAWRVVQLLGDCQVWDEGKPFFEPTGRHIESVGAQS